MSLVELKLPLETVSRAVSALERIATSLQNLEKWMIVPAAQPVYDRTKSHVSDVNWTLIQDIKDLNEERRMKGLPLFSTEEAVQHLRNEL